MFNIFRAEWLVILLGIFSLLAVPFLQNKTEAIRTVGEPATLQEFWNGQAEFKLVEKISRANGNWKFQPDYVTGSHIEVVGNNWYLFSRRTYYNNNSNCAWHSLSNGTQAGAGTVVRKSTDRGKTWSEPVDIIVPTPGKAWECLGTDGDAYYDPNANAWHYLFQCVGPDAKWRGCHVQKLGADPMGGFVEAHQNPVVDASELWGRICNEVSDDCHKISGGNVYDEGTYDIFTTRDGYYYVSFHGASGPYGFRGIAKTRDFQNWIAGDVGQGVPQDAVLDKFDTNGWKESWSGEPIGFGAGSIVDENGYYYMISEAADKNLACVGGAGQRWDWGIFRSNSLTSTNWEQPSQGNPLIYSLDNFGPCQGNPEYARVFKDGNTIYMHFSLSIPDANANAFYLYQLVKKQGSHLPAGGVGGMFSQSTRNIVPTFEAAIVQSTPAPTPVVTPAPTPMPNNPQAGACRPGQTLYSCADVRCPDGSTPPGGGCYPDSYVQDCLKNCSLPTPAPVVNYNTPYSTPVSVQSTVYPTPYTNPQPIGGACRDDCFSDDLRTNVGVNPSTGQCASGYQSVSHFCRGSNVGATQYCNGAPYRCVQSGPIYYWDSNY